MTIYDIARSCSVSIATVSRVLNGSNKVSPKTREKVLAAMNEHNYKPNPFARGLGLNSMKMIGILCTDVSDAFFAKAVSLVEHDLRKRGLDVILACTGNELSDKKKYLQLFLDKHVDAIILIGSPFREEQDNSHIEKTAKQIPIIIINSLLDVPNIYCVLCDEKEGMQKAIELLAKQNCDNILYLYDSLSYSGQQKLSGYKTAVQQYNLKQTPHLIQKIPRTLEAAEAITTKLLDSGIKLSAIAASEDLLAVGAQKALSARGLVLPVIGFNNSILAECSTPALTSIDNRLDVLCPAAVKILAQILSGDFAAAPSKTIFPSLLVERESFSQNTPTQKEADIY